MEAQRERARAARQGRVLDDVRRRRSPRSPRQRVPTEFVGYEHDEADAHRRRDRRRTGAAVETLEPGASAEVVLDRRRSTASRAARSATRASSTRSGAPPFAVDDTQIPRRARTSHIGEVSDGAALGRRQRSRRRSTSCAASASAATTPRRTCCTGRCGSCSASTCKQARLARRARPPALRLHALRGDDARAARARSSGSSTPRSSRTTGPRVRDVARDRP